VTFKDSSYATKPGTFGKSRYRTVFRAVPFSATPTFDFSQGQFQTITLTGNVTEPKISNLPAGEIVTFKICQDAIGGRAFIWPTGVNGAMTIGATAHSCSRQQFVSCDGSTLYSISSGTVNPVGVYEARKPGGAAKCPRCQKALPK
jgi:hypothetical protein